MRLKRVTAVVLLFKTVEHNLFETLTNELPFFIARIGSSHSTMVPSLIEQHPSALGNLEFMPCGHTSLPRVRVVNRGRGPWLRDAIDFASRLELPHRIRVLGLPNVTELPKRRRGCWTGWSCATRTFLSETRPLCPSVSPDSGRMPWIQIPKTRDGPRLRDLTSRSF